MTASLSSGNVSASPVAKPRKKSKLKWYLIGAVVLLGILVALGIAKKRAGGKGISVTTEKAVTKTIIQLVTATGKVQPEVEVKITPEVFGEITSLPFREGAAVKKGEVIVTIKPDFYQAQVDQQVAGVAAARAGAVNSLVQLEKAEADLKKYQDLYDRKLISDFDYVSYKTAFDAAKATRASALAGVDEAEGLLKQAKDSLSKTSIYAPMDGSVSSRSSEVGERVQSSSEFAGTEIMRVADLSKMEVRVKVNENDIVNVKVGDPVSISIDAYPDRKFKGVVREIAASADNAGASGSGTAASGTVSDEVTNFIVKIRVSDPDPERHGPRQGRPVGRRHREEEAAGGQGPLGQRPRGRDREGRRPPRPGQARARGLRKDGRQGKEGPRHDRDRRQHLHRDQVGHPRRRRGRLGPLRRHQPHAEGRLGREDREAEARRRHGREVSPP